MAVVASDEGFSAPLPIVSRHHLWVQQLPLRNHRLVCMDCGVSRPMARQDARWTAVHRCAPKIELPRSGYRGPSLAKWLASGREAPHGVFVMVRRAAQ